MKIIDPEQSNRLILFPVDPGFRITNPEVLHTDLQSIGLLDAKGAGPEFMKLLTFMGCSPSMGSGVQGGDYNNYSIELSARNDSMTLLARSRLRSPVCPRCGQRDSEALARDQVEETEAGAIWRCPSCDAELPVTEMNWRHRLAVAIDYIVIHGVHDGEVIPADRLLEYLAKVTGTSWSYCYC